MKSGDNHPKRASSLEWIQGGYYLATGLWPLLHMKSFEKVTGPKADDWLVRTVGLLVTITGAALLHSASRRERAAPSGELRFIAAAQAIALGGISLYYGARGRISRIYLLDAAAEAGLAGGAWVLSTKGSKGERPSSVAKTRRKTA